ncbi:MAG: hypothetical protein ABFD62_05020 [Syntrophaceae bacterium]
MFALNDETRWILGRPSFMVAKIAWRLKKLGLYEVATKAEDEQAVTIHWMLTLYEKYGDNWRDEARKILSSTEEQKEN